MRVWIIACLLAACGSKTSERPSGGGEPPANSGGTPRAPTKPPATAKPPPATYANVPDDVRKAVCAASPCGGDRSSINVYRDASGAVKRLFRIYGTCSHSPGIYFDAAGTQTEIIPEKPITPGSEEAKQIQAKHDAQVAGLTKAESLDCR
jgi:hypothetical protein